MRDIADAVGIRQSAIYNHVSSKQELLVNLMAGHMEAVLGEMTEAIEGIEDATARLEAFARFHVTYHIDYPEDVFLAYMEVRSLEGGKEKSKVLALRDAYERTVRLILEEGQASRDFSIGDAAVHARAILAMLTGVTVWYREGGRLDRDNVTATYARAVLQSVGCTFQPDERRGADI